MSNIHSIVTLRRASEDPDTQPLTLPRATGFTNSAAKYWEGGLDIDRALNPHPGRTFAVRLGDGSLATLGLLAGDAVLVDRSLDARPGRVLAVEVDGVMLVGVMRVRSGRAVLECGGGVVALDEGVVLLGVGVVGFKRLLGRR